MISLECAPPSILPQVEVSTASNHSPNNLSRRNLLVLSLLILLVAYMFRGSYAYGMNYDEVLRLNPFIAMVAPEARPLNQSIYSIRLGGRSLPLMFKEYISSLCSLPLVPALFFKDRRFGLRLMHQIYFTATIAVLFLFLQRYSFSLALATASIQAVAPYLYPEIRFGFAITTHIIFLVLALYFLEKAIRHDKWRHWILAACSLSLGVNLAFYFSWTVLGLGITTLVLFPRYLFRMIRRPKVIVAGILGFLIGGFNFVVYNISSRGATIRPLLDGLFNRDRYNERPIDYRPLPGLGDEILSKLNRFPAFFGGNSIELTVLGSLLFLAIVIYVTALVRAYKQGRLTEIARRYCFPLLATIVIFSLILITPKSGRVGHWVFIAPFLELSLIAPAFLIMSKKLFKRWASWRLLLSTAFLSTQFVACLFLSNRLVDNANERRGSWLFSPAIYDLHEDLAERTKAGDKIVAVDWGFTSQLYFLSAGRLPLSDWSFKLKSSSDEDAAAMMAGYMLDGLEADQRFFFLFHDREALAGTRSKFFHFLSNVGANLEIIETYVGGGNVHYLAKVANLHEVLGDLRSLLMKNSALGADSAGSAPRVKTYGPKYAVVGRGFNVQPSGESAMWFQLESSIARPEVLFGGVSKPFLFSRKTSTLTIAVDARETEREENIEIRICDKLWERCAEPIFFPVVDAEDLGK